MTNDELLDALRADGWDVLAVDDSLCSTPHKVIRFSGKALCAFASHDSRWKSYHAAVVKATDPDDIVQQLMLDDNERKFRTPPFRTLLPQYETIVDELKSEGLGRKDDEEKAAPQLIPPFAEAEVARVLAAGARKYSPENWRLVPDAGGPQGRYIGAALRHINAYRQGDQEDRETGLHPLAHAVASLLFVMELEL
jgi:hypothetical protein